MENKCAVNLILLICYRHVYVILLYEIKLLFDNLTFQVILASDIFTYVILMIRYFLYQSHKNISCLSAWCSNLEPFVLKGIENFVNAQFMVVSRENR
jgi:hypothetical protein